jgi:phosphohistidine phosphatase
LSHTDEELIMNVYLLRHGIAEERDAGKYPNDDERPLTEDGVMQMRQASLGIAALAVRPDLILTSPLVRTRQTAEIVAQALGCEDRIENSEELRPGATVATVRTLLSPLAGKGIESVILVGHEPDLGLIASGLIGAKGSVIEFKKGAICAIQLEEKHADRPGVLLWLLTPKHLRAISEGP